MAFGLEMERAYSGFSASQICHLLTYLDPYPRDPHGAGCQTDVVASAHDGKHCVTNKHGMTLLFCVNFVEQS